MSRMIATIAFDSTDTIVIRDIDGVRADRELTYHGDEDDALMAVHDDDWLTVGSTWHREMYSGTKWIDLEQMGPRPAGG